VLTPMRFDGQRPMAPCPPPHLDADGEAVRAAAQAGHWPGA
jgi:hypothetical protein